MGKEFRIWKISLHRLEIFLNWYSRHTRLCLSKSFLVWGALKEATLCNRIIDWGTHLWMGRVKPITWVVTEKYQRIFEQIYASIIAGEA